MSYEKSPPRRGRLPFVGAARFELTTSRSRTVRATKLRYAPNPDRFFVAGAAENDARDPACQLNNLILRFYRRQKPSCPPDPKLTGTLRLRGETPPPWPSRKLQSFRCLIESYKNQHSI